MIRKIAHGVGCVQRAVLGLCLGGLVLVAGGEAGAVDGRGGVLPLRKSQEAAAEGVPSEILALARARGLGHATITRKGNDWVACEGSAGVNQVCVVLSPVAGQATRVQRPTVLGRLVAGDTLLIAQYGQPLRRTVLSPTIVNSQTNRYEVERVGVFERVDSQSFRFTLQPGAEVRVSVDDQEDLMVDTLPRYRLEAPGLVRTKDTRLVQQYIDQHPSEPFMVLVTVPALCEPCRAMDQLLTNQRTSVASVPVKTFILEYFSFADAEREVLGKGAIFPTTLIYTPSTEPRTSISKMIGNLQGHSLEDLSRPLRTWVRRGAPVALTRGVVSPSTLRNLLQ